MPTPALSPRCQLIDSELLWYDLVRIESWVTANLALGMQQSPESRDNPIDVPATHTLPDANATKRTGANGPKELPFMLIMSVDLSAQGREL